MARYFLLEIGQSIALPWFIISSQLLASAWISRRKFKAFESRGLSNCAWRHNAASTFKSNACGKRSALLSHHPRRLDLCPNERGHQQKPLFETHGKCVYGYLIQIESNY